MNTTDYNKQANDFLKLTNTTFKAEFLKYGKHFDEDKDKRDIYTITLERGGRKYTFNFGQSINSSMQWIANNIYTRNAVHKLNYPRLQGNTKRQMLQNAKLPLHGWNNNDFIKNENYSEPTAYDVLACLTNYDPETFEDFCDNFGYDYDSMNANKTYKAVVNEWQNVCMLWNDTEIEQLQEIQ